MGKSKKNTPTGEQAKTFGTRLRQLREQNQLRQSALAEKCNISPAYLSDIERGRRNPPNDQTIMAWACQLNLSQAEDIGAELVALAAQDRDRVVVETEVEMAAAIGHHRPAPAKQNSGGPSATPFLDHFCIDLAELAKSGQLDAAEERQAVFAEIGAVVARRRTNSVLLHSASSGDILRTVHGLAAALADDGLSVPLSKIRLLSVEGLQAGVKYRGQLEERLTALLREAEESGPLLLYFHSLADLVDLESAANGSYLGPALLQSRVNILTGARPDELAYSRKINSGLVESFCIVDLPPLEQPQILRGLYARRAQYQDHHQLIYTDDALEAIAETIAGGDRETAWQRALDLLDEVGARQRLGQSKEPISAATVRGLVEDNKTGK